MTLWQQVLAALSDDTLDDATRKENVARGAAQLAVRQTPEGQQATPPAVLDTDFHESNPLLTVEQAREALREVGRVHE
ncbi:hypothetical protein [Streptomyces sp. NPDC059631]|uniref:hypothetical protein n=1 Tax=unclassified Streptomyces TaxID=2593676 RepID=UPI00367F08AF